MIHFIEIMNKVKPELSTTLHSRQPRGSRPNISNKHVCDCLKETSHQNIAVQEIGKTIIVIILLSYIIAVKLYSCKKGRGYTEEQASVVLV